MVASGDFNGGGNSDVLWQNGNSSAVVMYEMNGTQLKGSAAIGGGGGWSVVATADYDGDGNSDILWQNSNSGAATLSRVRDSERGCPRGVQVRTAFAKFCTAASIFSCIFADFCSRCFVSFNQSDVANEQ